MNKHQLRGGFAAALSLTALATVAPLAAAVGDATGHNSQVALVDGTGDQLEFSSDVNGTAPVVAADGRLTVFSTEAPLVPSDDNGMSDVYVRDTSSGTTVLVSQRNGVVGNDESLEPTISADGTRIAFTTWATNLTARDGNGSALDVLVKDMGTDRLRRVSQTTAGSQRPQSSMTPVISSNGRAVTFQSRGSFDARDDDRNEDVYVRNLATGRTTLVSLHPGGRDIRAGVLNGDISDDGKRVVFGNANFVWVRFLDRGETLRIWQEPDLPPCQPNPVGSLGRPTISGNGRFVAVSSCATDLPREDGRATDIYRFALGSGEIRRMHARGDDNSYSPSLSRGGRFLGFGSDATNLVTGDDEGQPDAFVADLVNRTVVRASEGPDGVGGNSWNATVGVSISSDGRSLAYSAYSDNLVEGDLFPGREVFVWHR